MNTITSYSELFSQETKQEAWDPEYGSVQEWQLNETNIEPIAS